MSKEYIVALEELESHDMLQRILACLWLLQESIRIAKTVQEHESLAH